MTGAAEAEAMRLKAEAFEQYGQAAILDKIITNIPTIAQHIAAPLANVERIVVISTDGTSAGVNRITGDIAKIVAQTPEIIESLTGQKIGNLLHQLDELASENSNPANGKSDTIGDHDQPARTSN